MIQEMGRIFSEFIQFSVAGQLSPASLCAIIALCVLLNILYRRYKDPRYK